MCGYPWEGMLNGITTAFWGRMELYGAGSATPWAGFWRAGIDSGLASISCCEGACLGGSAAVALSCWGRPEMKRLICGTEGCCTGLGSTGGPTGTGDSGLRMYAVWTCGEGSCSWRPAGFGVGSAIGWGGVGGVGLGVYWHSLECPSSD